MTRQVLVDESTLKELLDHMSEAINQVRLLSDIARGVVHRLDYGLQLLDKLSNTSVETPPARVRAETRPYPSLSGDPDPSTKRVDGEH